MDHQDRNLKKMERKEMEKNLVQLIQSPISNCTNQVHISPLLPTPLYNILTWCLPFILELLIDVIFN